MMDSIRIDCNPKSGNIQLPRLGSEAAHAYFMEDAQADEPDEARALIAKNIATLVPTVFGTGATPKGIKEIRDASGISNGTVGRIVTPSMHSWSISLLPAIAKALKVQPWELLLPDLEVSGSGAVISLKGLKARQWPFPSFRREEMEGLGPNEIDRLEKTMRARIQELREDMAKNNKPAPTGKHKAG